LAAAEAGMDSTDRRNPGSLPDIEVIASIAKELRQSMSSIIEYTDLLLGETVGMLGATQRNFIEHVRSAIEKMEGLADNLLQITAVETSKFSLTPEPVDLLQCIEESVTKASAALRDKKLALRMDLPDQIPPIIGEEGVIVQIVAHLLNNAIGASPEGEEIIIAARIQEAEDAEFVMLTISDAGEGIPIEDLGRVFQRVEPADYAPISGLGDSTMGLSIIQELSEAIGGRIWFDSEVGIGSTFTILMPVTDSSRHEMNNKNEG
jgi:signal transduction histidine kinase